MEPDVCETENNCGRETIIPDDIAIMAIKAEPDVIEQDGKSMQSLTPEVSYIVSGNFNESVPQSSTLSMSKNPDILAILKEIALSQKEFNTRLEKLEQNQIRMHENQSILSIGQSEICTNQQQIINILEKLESSVVSKPELMAHSKLLMDCKVATKRVEESVRRMTEGDYQDAKMDEIASMLPLRSVAGVREMEDNLEAADFEQAAVTYINKLKGTSEDVGSIIRSIFTDDLLEMYNWEGRWEKQSLGKLKLFNKTLRDVFQKQGAFEFEKSVKKAIERSHNRKKQQKYISEKRNSMQEKNSFFE